MICIMPRSTFETEFLAHYLRAGLGAMPKADVDALVMHLVDRHGLGGSGPLAALNAQTASERLRVPVLKLKKLRYEAVLKFGGRPEDEAQARLLATLARASFDEKDGRISLQIEDRLAREWLEGQLQLQQQLVEHQLHREVLTLPTEALFRLLAQWFDAEATAAFQADVEAARAERLRERRRQQLRAAGTKFAQGVLGKLSQSVAALIRLQLGL